MNPDMDEFCDRVRDELDQMTCSELVELLVQNSEAGEEWAAMAEYATWLDKRSNVRGVRGVHEWIVDQVPHSVVVEMAERLSEQWDPYENVDHDAERKEA